MKLTETLYQSKKKLIASLLLAGLAVQALAPTAHATNEIIKSYEEDEYIIVYKNEAGKDLAESKAVDIEDDLDNVNILLADMKKKDADALERNKNIAIVQKNFEIQMNDASFKVMSETEMRQKNLLKDNRELLWNIDMVGADDAFKEGYSGKGVKVAVLDTGITKHPDLDIKGGVSFISTEPTYQDLNGHGTHVAGTIGAKINNGGIVGVAPNADLYAVKVLGANGKGDVNGIVQGIAWSIENDMDVVNMSLGLPVHVPILEYICKLAEQNGVILVGANGNDGNAEGIGENMGYPAMYDSVISVSAVDKNYKRAWFSSTGKRSEVSAPGVEIISTYADGKNYAISDGTSMASPHIAGVMAILKEKHPKATNHELRQMLRNYVTDLGEPGHDAWYGHGFVEYERDYPPHDAQVKLIESLIKTTSRQTTEANYKKVIEAMEDLRDGEDKERLQAQLDAVLEVMISKAEKAVKDYERSTMTIFYNNARTAVDALFDSPKKDELNARIHAVILELEDLVEKRLERAESRPSLSACSLVETYLNRLPAESDRLAEFTARLDAVKALLK